VIFTLDSFLTLRSRRVRTDHRIVYRLAVNLYCPARDETPVYDQSVQRLGIHLHKDKRLEKRLMWALQVRTKQHSDIPSSRNTFNS
jgi:hypothetical protein